MANVTKMDVINAIEALYKKGWSIRRISRELGIHRNTVRRYIEAYRDQSAPNPTPGNLLGPRACVSHTEAGSRTRWKRGFRHNGSIRIFERNMASKGRMSR